MHNFEQVKDVLDYGKKIHEDLSGFYDSINAMEQQTRVRMLLDYLSRHERHLEQTLERYESETHKQQILETWLQYSPSINIEKMISCQNIHPDMDTDEVIRLAIGFDDALVELYKEAEAEVDAPHVREVLENLVALESHEKLKMVRDTLMFNDL